MTEVRLRMDRSRKFSTVHGESVPGDVNHGVFYKQDGLPFDAAGILVEARLTPDQRNLADHKIKKLKAVKPVKNEAGDDDEPAETEGAASDDVNFEAWLRGEVRYPPFTLFGAAKKRFQVNKTKIADLVEFLVFEQRVIPENEVSPKLLPREAA